MTANVLKTKLVIAYVDGQGKSSGTFTYSNFKKDVSSVQLVSVAEAITALQAKLSDKYYKVVETELKD